MDISEVSRGALVRLHPVIGGKDDGNVYQVRAVGCDHGRPVAWLYGLQGSVDLRALSRAPRLGCPRWWGKG